MARVIPLIPADAPRCAGHGCAQGDYPAACDCGAGRLADDRVPELGKQFTPRSTAQAFADVRAAAIERPAPSLLRRAAAALRNLWSRA